MRTELSGDPLFRLLLKRVNSDLHTGGLAHSSFSLRDAGRDLSGDTDTCQFHVSGFVFLSDFLSEPWLPM